MFGSSQTTREAAGLEERTAAALDRSPRGRSCSSRSSGSQQS